MCFWGEPPSSAVCQGKGEGNSVVVLILYSQTLTDCSVGPSLLQGSCQLQTSQPVACSCTPCSKPPGYFPGWTQRCGSAGSYSSYHDCKTHLRKKKKTPSKEFRRKKCIAHKSWRAHSMPEGGMARSGGEREQNWALPLFGRRVGGRGFQRFTLYW